jgi:predicted nucleic acid-binding protein
MASLTKRVYWDACVWLALILREKIPLSGGGVEDRETMCRMVIEAAKKGSLEILTSTFCLVEVCKVPADKKATSDKVADFFENDYILLTNVDRMVAERARELMARHPGLKPPDAVHVATAAVSPGVEEMHSFDDRLLALNGAVDKADGTKLKICKPDAGAPPAPLLEAIHGENPEEKK